METFVDSIDFVPCNLPKSKGTAKAILLEDNEAVIKMTIKGRSPNMRHVARTHRVDLDWLFERIREDPGISIRYVNTKDQIADLLTKGAFTTVTWKTLCSLSSIGPLKEENSKLRLLKTPPKSLLEETLSVLRGNSL